jgi:hypothetical protein
VGEVVIEGTQGAERSDVGPSMSASGRLTTEVAIDPKRTRIVIVFAVAFAWSHPCVVVGPMHFAADHLSSNDVFKLR